MKNKIKVLISGLLVLMLFLVPCFMINAEEGEGTGTDPENGTEVDPGTEPEPIVEVATVNNQQGYPTIEAAIAAATNGDKVTVIMPVTLSADLTVPEGITLATTSNTITIPADKTLTVNGTLYSSSMGKIVNSGTIVIENGGVFNADSEIKIQSGSQINLKGNAVINVGGTLDLAINTKIVSEAVDGPVINIKTTGAIVGNANALDTANKVLFNNYGGRFGEDFANKVNEGYYNTYYLLHEESNTYYKTFEELTGPIEVKLIAPFNFNGDVEIPEFVVVKTTKNNGIKVNGTLEVNGTIDMSSGDTLLIAYNLYGNGYVIINKATEMAQGYLTNVVIYKDVATTLTFDAATGYTPAINDILFELGTTEKEAIAIAAKIKLGDTFDRHAIAPKATQYSMINGGYSLGVISEEISDIVGDCDGPQTGNGSLFILGLISLSAAGAAVYCSRKIYILNRI